MDKLSAVVSTESGRKFPLSGNQAAARGAVEAGASLAVGCPGIHTTTVLDVLINLHEYHNIASFWSINEKVALETAAAYSWLGYRCLVSMTALGLNVAAPSLASVSSFITEGGLVIYVTDDPGAHFGRMGRDSSYYARLAGLPMLEPSTPQELKDWIVRAFESSERTRIPIIVRVTRYLAQTISPVVLGDGLRVQKQARIPDHNFSPVCPDITQCLHQQQDIERRCVEASNMLEDLSVLELRDPEIGVVTCGATDPIFREFLESHTGINPSVLKVALSFPPPVNRVASLLEHCQTIVILEEMEPMMEIAFLSEAERLGLGVRIVGKRNRPELCTGEYDSTRLTLLMAEAIGEDLPLPAMEGSLMREAAAMEPKRPLTFCSGCPHRATYYAIGQALSSLGLDRKDVVITGDLGCGMLGKHEPFPTPQMEMSMGASIGLALGLQCSNLDKPVIAVIGDGSFFHSGLPAILEAIHRQADITIIVLDNGCNAITGGQKNPGSRKELLREETRIDLAPLLRSAGLRFVRRASPFAQKKMVRAIVDALRSSQPSVILAQAPCAQMIDSRRSGQMIVNSSKCVGLDACPQSCINLLACPSLEVDESGKVRINAETCARCGLCKDVCPHKAISRSWSAHRIGRDRP